MEAPLSTVCVVPPQARTTAIVRCAASAAIVCLFCLSLLLAWRQSKDQLQQTLAAGWLIAIGVSVCGALGLSRASWKRTRCRDPAAWRGVVLQLIAASASVLLVYSLSSVAEPKAAALLWAIVLVSEASAWLLWSDLNWSMLRGKARPRASLIAPATSPPVHNQRAEMSVVKTADAPASEVLQQITRTRGGEGNAMLFGTIRGEFVPHQRTESLHIAFCPPLNRAPQLAVEQIDGPAARLKVAQVESFGARIDVRLAAGHAVATSVVVEFFATSSETQTVL